MKNALPLLPRIAAVFVCATCGVTAVAAHSQDWAKAVLNKSPRHQEWVKVTYGSRTVNAFVVLSRGQPQSARRPAHPRNLRPH